MNCTIVRDRQSNLAWSIADNFQFALPFGTAEKNPTIISQEPALPFGLN